jgi:hypothetical protein
MTLENTLLQKLSEWRPAAGRQQLTVPDAATGWAVLLTADRNDVLGCLVWDLTVRRNSAPAARAEDVRAWAERLARRVTGLTEPLKVLEVDETRLEAILRSESPSQRGEQRLYHEVFLKGTSEATLRRYQAPREGAARREQTAFPLTHEVLVKLAGDLTAEK